jgi:hypothetical protein
VQESEDLKLWCILANVTWTTEAGWGTATSVPTFFLDPNIQAIRDGNHACEIARKIIDPLGVLGVHVGVKLDTNGEPDDDSVVFRTFKPEVEDDKEQQQEGPEDKDVPPAV